MWTTLVFECPQGCNQNYRSLVRLKKINGMSQSSWQIGRPDLNAFFFFYTFFFFLFSWAADVPDLSRSQLWNMELDFWMNKIQDRTQSWKSLLFKVFHCVCHIFSCIFLQVHKKLEKKLSKQKKFKPWILLNQMRTEKQMRAAALRQDFFFLALKAVH